MCELNGLPHIQGSQRLMAVHPAKASTSISGARLRAFNMSLFLRRRLPLSICEV
jgi:hypothetical protein